MKKLLLTALLFAIATPYGAKASHDVQKTSATVKTKKPSKPKPADLKRRSSAMLVTFVVWVGSSSLIYLIASKLSGNWKNFLGKDTDKKLSFLLILLLELSSTGKHYHNLKLVDMSGEEATFSQKLIRALVKLPVIPAIGFFYSGKDKVHFVINTIIGIWIAIIPISVRMGVDYRGLPDWIANTVVVEVEETAVNA